MSSLVQNELVGAAVYIGFPLYYLMTSPSWSGKNQRYYDYLSSQSRLYPSGRAQNIFWVAWTILYTFIGVASYLFWRDHSPLPGQQSQADVDAYLAGNVLHWVGLLFNVGWSRVFFDMRRPRVAFVYALLALAGGLGLLVCSALLGAVVSAVLMGFYVAWMVFAVVLTGTAAFSVKPYKYNKADEEDMPASSSSSSSSLPNGVVEDEKQARRPANLIPGFR